MSEIRVVVVSDRRLSGLALAGALGLTPGASIVAEFSQVADAKSCCERGEADAVLVDASVLAHTEFRQDRTTYFQADLLSILTPRERQVFALLGNGRSNAHIGKLLGVSEATVKSHVGRILAKLKLESRLQAGLAASAHETGLSQP